MYLEKLINKKVKVGSGSGFEFGSISQRHGSADPDKDPHQNFMDTETGCNSSIFVVVLKLFSHQYRRELRPQRAGHWAGQAYGRQQGGYRTSRSSPSSCTLVKYGVRSSVADPGCLSRIPDPDFLFYPSRIPDLGSRIQKQQQKIGVENNLLSYLFM